MRKAKEFRDMSVEELDEALRNTSAELFTLGNEARLAKKLEKPHRLREKRRERARILTVLTEKQANNNRVAR